MGMLMPSGVDWSNVGSCEPAIWRLRLNSLLHATSCGSNDVGEAAGPLSGMSWYARKWCEPEFMRISMRVTYVVSVISGGIAIHWQPSYSVPGSTTKPGGAAKCIWKPWPAGGGG